METAKANKIDDVKDTKSGQSKENRVDNAMYENYANMSAAEIAKLRSARKARTSLNGKVLNTYVPEDYKNPNLYYEWMVYDPIVIDQKIKDGWVIVSDKKLADMKGCSTTSEVKIPSGTTTNRGEPEYLILMAIHKVLHDEDVAAQKQRMIDFDKAISTGKEIVDDKGQSTAKDIEFKSKEVSIE